MAKKIALGVLLVLCTIGATWFVVGHGNALAVSRAVATARADERATASREYQAAIDASRAELAAVTSRLNAVNATLEGYKSLLEQSQSTIAGLTESVGQAEGSISNAVSANNRTATGIADAIGKIRTAIDSITKLDWNTTTTDSTTPK